MRDLHNSIKTSPAITPRAITAGDATLTGEILDTKGYDSAEVSIMSGAVTDGTFTPTLYESDASNMSGETAVADADLLGTEQTFVGTTSADDNACKRFGYRGSKRYIRVKIVQTGATTGGFICAEYIQSHPHQAPVA